ncbi:FAD-dependent oxidoreductase [Ruminococcus sp. Marseille-P6503]|uniref:NAD(P)/FAD-dependent oxidoreductase n=1 Tax=Ruminococcus sp. Marseille-P6503 TaxID=2364796 RepID=UPI0019D0A497|nr:FAD-dependent oxidoreductase [Ruminococcus sp. Marseille-P6503]
MIKKELIIIGSGAAGLTAAIYASRAGLDFSVIERYPLAGGQIVNTSEVDNYPGFIRTTGAELSQKLREHAEDCRTDFITDCVSKIKKQSDRFEIKGEKETYYSKTVIAACGAARKKLGVKGEDRLSGSGVSYCAVCDGAFFRGRTAAVIGGGNTAAEEALYLSKLAKKVYLVHRRDKLKANKALQSRLHSAENIQTVLNCSLAEIIGDHKVEAIEVKRNGVSEVIHTDGVFSAIGISPESGLLQGLAQLDEYGFAIAGEDCKTSAEGLFAAGDIRSKPLRQIVTAAADGASAVLSAEKYLNG